MDNENKCKRCGQFTTRFLRNPDLKIKICRECEDRIIILEKDLKFMGIIK